MNLNERQREAIENIYGPMLIIAGPGSGKTRTLVERVIYMSQSQGIDLRHILITTFTERAARELKTRIFSKIGTNIDVNTLYIGTIHSICLKIIDKYLKYSRIKRGYSVLENIDQRLFIFSKLKELKKIDGFEKYFEKKGVLNNWKIAGYLQKWFNKISEEGKSTEELLDSPNFDLNFLGECYEKYQCILFENNKLDFATIQLEAFKILSENKDILEEVQNEIRFIMVDEYQDTNSIQEKIIFLLGSKERNICVVGDDDQGIYRFRGATIKNILQFKDKMGDACKIVKLETNYRSEKNIVDFCDSWINSLRWDEFRHEKKLKVPIEKEIDKTRVVKLSVTDSESKWQERIADFLVFMKKSGKIENYNQVAFLFRSVRNKKVVSLAHYLEYRGIGVYSPRSNLFFLREEVMRIIGGMLYILLDSNSEILNSQYKSEIVDYYKKCLNIVKKELHKNIEILEELEKIRENYRGEFKNTGGLLNVFYEVLNSRLMFNYLEKESNNLLENRKLYNLGIFSKIVEKCDRISNILIIDNENIKRVISYFFTMHLKYLKQSGVDEYEDLKEFAPKGAVSFLTIHQSKGLEFPIVVVGSLESTPEVENDFESQLEKAFKWDDFEPEQRIKDFDFWRLYYTAFSRAKDLLVLTCVESNKGKKIVPSLPFKRVYENMPDIVDGNLKFRELDISNISRIDIKETYSYTSDYLRYKECPFRYRLNKVFEFKRIKRAEMFFGTLIHETLEFLNKELLIKKDLNLKEIKDIYMENYNFLSKNEGIKLKESILENGFKQIEKYLENKVIISNIIDVEKELNYFFEDFIINGKLDLVIEKNNELYVVDFKTGNLEKGEEQLDNYVQQIKLYCLLLEESSEKIVKGGIVYSVKDGTELNISYCKEDGVRIVEEFKKVIDRIENNEFSEKIREEKKCLKCEFKKHCFSVNMI